MADAGLGGAGRLDPRPHASSGSSECCVAGGARSAWADFTSSQAACHASAHGALDADPCPPQAAIEEQAVAEMMQNMIGNGIPLTLLFDLINPFGPESQRTIDEELAELDQGS